MGVKYLTYNENDITDVIVNKRTNTEVYYSTIRNYPVLSKEEVDYLFNEYKKGNKKAKEDIVNCNLRLAYKMALNYSYKTKRLDKDDLIQEANIILMKSVDLYAKSNLDITFTTFVANQIKFNLYRIIWNNDNLYRVPDNYREYYSKIRKAYEFSNKYSKKKLTIENLSKLTGLSEDNINKTLKYMQQEIYLDSEVKNNKSKDGKSKQVKDLINDSTSLSLFEMYIEKELKKDLIEALNELPRTDQLVLTNSIKNEMLNTKVTKDKFISFIDKDKNKVNHVQQRAIRKLRQNQKIKAYSEAI